MKPLSSPRSRSTRRQPRHAASRGKRCRPLLEALEDRSVPAGFSFADFTSSADLTLLGSAAVTPDHRLRLTPAVRGQAGAAWFTTEKQFAGLAFETTFQFQLTENVDAPGGSDGFAFLIQNFAPTFVGGSGGSLGYSGLQNSLAVEFDTFQNSEAGDPSGSHISVHTNGTGANGMSETLSLGSYNTSPIMDDAAVHTVKITYTPGTLSVYLDNMSTPKLTVAVDLAEKLGLDAGKAWVGFTAATGGGWQNHDVLNWTYTTPGDVSTTVWVSDASVVEGDSGTSNLVFTVNRSGVTTGTTTVNWATENRTAAAGSDYAAASNQVVFAPGETQQTVTIAVNGDTSLEPHEALALRLSGPSGGAIADGVGVGTILTDDVTISVSDATATEGSASYRYIDDFVTSQSGGLSGPRDILFGPDWNGDGQQDFYVTSKWTNQVLSYDGVTGTFLGVVIDSNAGCVGPWAMTLGPDGNLYVGGGDSNNVIRHTFSTGLSDVYVPAGSGGLIQPRGIAFGPDGHLYVSCPTPRGIAVYDEVLRFEGPFGAQPGSPLPAPGQPRAVFIPNGSGGANALNVAKGLAFGPDGNLYVANGVGDSINRYDGTTGAFVGVFVPAGSGGLNNPYFLIFRPDGRLYVSSQDSGQVLRFGASSGAFVDVFIPSGPYGTGGMAFDASGNLYDSSGASGSESKVVRFGPASLAAFTVSLSSPSAVPVTVSYITADGTATAGSDYTPVSGTLTFAPGQITRSVFVQALDDSVAESAEMFFLNLSAPVGATISDATGLATLSDNEPTVSINDVSLYEGNAGATTATFTVTLSRASAETVTVSYATANGSATTANNDYFANSNVLTFLPGQTSQTLSVTVNGDTAAEANETFFVNLSSSPNALLVDAQGVGTILDDDGTKFFVVDDGTADRTYRYTAPGAALGNNTLGSGNTKPRGAASNLAGDKVWVVDQNKKVYVYNASGGLLGSWTAGSLASNAQVEGIAVDPNGTDVWIVDDRQGKVFKYAGAATRLTGTQNAASSFDLNSANGKPRDIVTDGTSLWVVNVSNTYHKVFKYTVSGTLIGSWDIMSGGGSPTGITLDPSNPSHLWIVDSNTDLVYQFDGAAGRYYGQQYASTTFALAAGNTNPQGIADPPVPTGSLRTSIRRNPLPRQAEPERSLVAPSRVARPGEHDKAVLDYVFADAGLVAALQAQGRRSSR